jgi:hypothetical protein
MIERSPLIALARALPPFFRQQLRDNKTDPVFSTVCCDRLYVGFRQPQKCRTCSKSLTIDTHASPVTVEGVNPAGLHLDFVVLHLKRAVLEASVRTPLANRRIVYTWKHHSEDDPEIVPNWADSVQAEADEQDFLERNPHLL